MGGVWQSLKQKLSRRHADHKSLDSKPTSNGCLLQSKNITEAIDSPPTSGLNGAVGGGTHRPDAEPEHMDEVQNFQLGEQAIEAGMSVFNSEQRELICSKIP